MVASLGDKLYPVTAVTARAYARHRPEARRIIVQDLTALPVQLLALLLIELGDGSVIGIVEVLAVEERSEERRVGKECRL